MVQLLEECVMLTGELSCSELDFERHGSVADEMAPEHFFEKRHIIQEIRNGRCCLCFLSMFFTIPTCGVCEVKNLCCTVKKRSADDVSQIKPGAWIKRRKKKTSWQVSESNTLFPKPNTTLKTKLTSMRASIRHRPKTRTGSLNVNRHLISGKSKVRKPLLESKMGELRSSSPSTCTNLSADNANNSTLNNEGLTNRVHSTSIVSSATF